jgi:NTE family protein
MFYRRLLFCGGGVRVIAHVGALEKLKDEITFVKEFCGVSAGALLAMCMAIGYSLAELREFILGFDFTNVMDTATPPELLLNFGLDTGNRLQKMVEACIRVKGLSGEITFNQLHKGLRVYATNLNNGEYITFSKETTPTMKVADAVRASMSFPYYFQPYSDSSGHLFGDGGIISNFPMFTFSDVEKDHTIGFLFEETCEEVEEIYDFGQFMMRPFIINMQSRSKADIRSYKKWSVISKVGNISPLDFSLDDDTKMKLLTIGKDAAEEWLKRKQIIPTRRYSAC